MDKMYIKYRLKYCLAILACFAGFMDTRAQYYYKDIITTRQINQTYALLKANKVSQVSFGAFIQNDAVQDGLQLEQTINARLNRVTTHTNTAAAGESWLNSYYDDNGLLIKSVDSTEETTTITQYSYNARKQLVQISSTATGKDNSIVTEVHDWFYNSGGQPENMMKIKNGTDTTFVNFIADDKGNPGEERATRNKYSLGITYYYYDSNNHLTDVARYHKKADRILPDYMFEYNNNDQLTQMIVVPDGSSDYQTWRYTYNEQGLKQVEACYNKQKQLAGKVEYIYKYNN
jgi:YD repeat-containing protein